MDLTHHLHLIRVSGVYVNRLDEQTLNLWIRVRVSVLP